MKDNCNEYNKLPLSIGNAKNSLPSIEILHQVSDFFDAFSTPTRLKILYSLMNQELCTCDLSDICEMSLSAISHQLRILKDRKLIVFRKEGKNVYYSLDDKHILDILKISIEHINER